MKPPGTPSEFQNPWPQTARIQPRAPAPIWGFLLPASPRCGTTLCRKSRPRAAFYKRPSPTQKRGGYDSPFCGGHLPSGLLLPKGVQDGQAGFRCRGLSNANNPADCQHREVAGGWRDCYRPCRLSRDRGPSSAYSTESAHPPREGIRRSDHHSQRIPGQSGKKAATAAPSAKPCRILGGRGRSQRLHLVQKGRTRATPRVEILRHGRHPVRHMSELLEQEVRLRRRRRSEKVHGPYEHLLQQRKANIAPQPLLWVLHRPIRPSSAVSRHRPTLFLTTPAPGPSAEGGPSSPAANVAAGNRLSFAGPPASLPPAIRASNFPRRPTPCAHWWVLLRQAAKPPATEPSEKQTDLLSQPRGASNLWPSYSARPPVISPRARPQITAGFFGGWGGLHHELPDPAKPPAAARARGRNRWPLGRVRQLPAETGKTTATDPRAGPRGSARGYGVGKTSGSFVHLKPRSFAARARGRNWLSHIGT